MDTYQNDGEIAIVGDFNCHFGHDLGRRYWGATTPNGKSVIEMTNRHGLLIADGDDTLCSGPTYTFNVEGVGTSYIDHCVVSKPLIQNIDKCEVLEDCILNTSDHLALSLSLKVNQLPLRHHIQTNSKIAWSKHTNEELNDQYEKPLTVSLEPIIARIENADANNLEQIIQDITEAIHTCSNKLKKSKYSKGLKPYWDKILNELNKDKSAKWKIWCEAGKILYGPEYNEYKESKARFRKELRRAKLEYEKAEMTEINRAHEIDHKYFWQLVNRSRKKRRGISPLQKDKKTISDPTEIKHMWKSYFEELLTPSDKYDEEFKEHIEDSFSEIWHNSYNIESELMKKRISDEEVIRCIRKLKNCKAPGWDRLTAEHLKHGGSKLVETLVHLFNRIIEIEVYPKQLKVGIIVPIPKGDKDVTIMGNNRGITLLPVISKLLDNVLYERHLEWNEKNQPFDPLQGAGQERCSSTHTSLLLREAISHNLEKGNAIYVALLDTQKAFDTVWVKGVFVKLFHTGMDPVIWRILVLSYKDFMCHVRVGEEISEGFYAGQGLHQGAHWSMHMFSRHYNDMLKDLRNDGRGAKIDHLYVGNPTFADDVSIASLHKPVLQQQLNRVYQYSLKWRFKFNASKSVIIIFGNDTCPDISLTLGETVIPVRGGDLHMGIFLGQNKELEAEFVRKRINKAKRAFFAAQSIGSSTHPTSPRVLSKLYWSNCMSCMSHGLEILPLNHSSLQTLEQEHGSMAKMAQGQPKQTANVTPTATLGWRSFECHLDLTKMLFLWRILLLPMQNIYKQTSLLRLCYHLYATEGIHSGPLNDIIDVFRKYGLLKLLDDAMKSGHVMSINSFKSIAKDTVDKCECTRFRISCMLYKSLSLFAKCVQTITMWPWWIFADHFPEHLYKVRHMYRLLVSQGCIRSHVAMYTKSSPVCILCPQNSPETTEHFLFDCDHFDRIRGELWQSVHRVLPAAMQEELHNMSSLQKAEFLLSGFGCQFVPEWSDVYIQVCKFCYTMYNVRRDVQNN